MAHGNFVTRSVYKYSPWILKNLIANYYGFKMSFRKYGKHYREYFDFLNQSQWFSLDQIKNFQIQELRRIIEYSFNNVPYYNELFKKLKITPDDINSVTDLRKLPILTKEDVRNNYSKLISNQYKQKDLIVSRTSGTTGKALQIALTKESYQKEQAFIWFHRLWGGIKYRDKTATIAGHLVIDTSRSKPPFWVHNRYEKQVLFSSYHLSKDNLKYYIDKMVRFRPKLIWGYPSSIYVIALYLEKESVTDIRPKAIFTSSETLFDFQREKIENAFQTKVFNYYANAEMVSCITECEYGNLHIKHEHGIVEFVDENNNPVKYGEEGRMVCTGFINYAMPLIRYDVGDVAIPINKKCKCGRENQVLEEIVGRVDDYVITPQKRMIGRLDHIFKQSINIEEAQIIQENKNEILIKVVKRPKYNDKDTKRLMALLNIYIRDELRVKIEFVKNIPRLSNGKFRFVISNVKI